MELNNENRTYAFIDASNLFYGGEKSLGWKVDYQKLLKYLRERYNVDKAFYFGGVETVRYQYDYLRQESVPLKDVEKVLRHFIAEQRDNLDKTSLLLLDRYLHRIRFYMKLQEFGYELRLKLVKEYRNENGEIRRKANCDVEMAFYLMREKDNFDRAIVLSGDGDFLPLLKYLREQGKQVFILARGPRTAREIRQFAGGDFRDFVRLEKYVRWKKK